MDGAVRQLGLDLGGTKIKLAVLEDGRCVARDETETRSEDGPEAVLERLVELGREHAYHKLVLAAFPVNAAGMALYERCGFRTVGVYREQGLLDGAWVDVIVMERLL